MTSTSIGKDVFWKLNSLAGFATGLVGRYTIVDLRNDASANGKIEEVDGFLNVMMSDVVFTDPCGQEFYFSVFFVKNRQIRYVHIPKEVEETLLRALDKIKNPRTKLKRTEGAAGFKASKLIQRQIETLKRVEEIKKAKLEEKNKKMAEEAASSLKK